MPVNFMQENSVFVHQNTTISKIGAVLILWFNGYKEKLFKSKRL